MLLAFMMISALSAAPNGGVQSALDDLTSCKKLRSNRCLVAATNLSNQECKVTKPTAKRFGSMTPKGQILALGVLDACKKRAGSKALMNVLRNVKYADVIRSLAIEALTRRPGKKVTVALLKTLNDKRVPVRSAAARSLGNRTNGKQSTKVMNALLEVARDDDSTVRLEALISLRLARAKKAGGVFTLGLTDEEPRVQQAAAEGLKRLKYPASVRPLIETLRSRNGLLREIALKALVHQTGLSYPEDYPLWLEWYQNR
jgi:hypothetical protein